MSRTLLNFVLDCCLLAAFVGVLAIAVVLRFVFPAPTQADAWSLWGMSYDDWSVVGFNATACFALLVLFHVMLHWSWVCGVVGQRFSKRLGRTVRIDEASQTVYGVGLLIVVLTVVGIVTAAAMFSIRELPSSARSAQSGQANEASAV